MDEAVAAHGLGAGEGAVGVVGVARTVVAGLAVVDLAVAAEGAGPVLVESVVVASLSVVVVVVVSPSVVVVVVVVVVVSLSVAAVALSVPTVEVPLVVGAPVVGAGSLVLSPLVVACVSVPVASVSLAATPLSPHPAAAIAAANALLLAHTQSLMAASYASGSPTGERRGSQRPAAPTRRRVDPRGACGCTGDVAAVWAARPLARPRARPRGAESGHVLGDMSPVSPRRRQGRAGPGAHGSAWRRLSRPKVGAHQGVSPLASTNRPETASAPRSACSTGNLAPCSGSGNHCARSSRS
ncbi:hypothetical protein [Nannocystis pusilla]|uniref:hypothetical protein n=1 Tax=Nannocystis pusilla TaxID=889268 RepID=UPI003B7DD983